MILDGVCMSSRICRQKTEAIGVRTAGTKTLGDRDGKATAHAHAETDDEKVDGSGGTDGGEGIHTQKLSNDDGIYQTVELLKEHTHQKRQGETKDQ